MTARGKFIVIEGPDGVGKSTCARYVVETLRDRGVSVSYTFEPSVGPIGALIREILKGRARIGEDHHAHTMALLFEADRLEHAHNDIEPKLQLGMHVVCDRYTMSNAVYQGIAAARAGAAPTTAWARKCSGDIAVSFRRWLSHVTSPAMLPDGCVILRAPVEVLRSRIAARGLPTTMYEDGSFLEEVVRDYNKVPPGASHFIEIDASQELSDVQSRVLKAVEVIIAA